MFPRQRYARLKYISGLGFSMWRTIALTVQDRHIPTDAEKIVQQFSRAKILNCQASRGGLKELQGQGVSHRLLKPKLHGHVDLMIV